MELNESYLIEELETVHPEYEEYIDTLLLIENLVAGGHETNKKKRNYLLIRDDEDPKITAKREEKFFTRNHLASAIRLQRTKLGTGKLDYPEKLPGSMDVWNDFFSNADGQGTDFKEVLLEAFEQALTYRRVFAIVDIPPSEEQPSNARQQELIEQARIAKGDTSLPYIILLPTSNVINWHEDAKGISWLKYKIVSCNTQPVGPAITSVMWIIVDREHITIYGLDDVQLNEEGEVIRIKQGEAYRAFLQAEDRIPVLYREAHNRGTIPVEKIELPPSMWTVNQCYLAQKMLYSLDCNLLHSTVNAGFIQKWLEPYFQQGTSAIQLPPDVTKKLMEEVQKVQGDESTLAVKSFNFAEVEGKSIGTQLTVIEEISKYIYSTISLNIASVSREVLEQSGRSKQLDMYLQEITLSNYGVLLVKFGESVLRHVARALGISSNEELTQITLKGLDDFTVEGVEEALERLELASKVTQITLPPLVVKMLVRDLLSTASRNSSNEERDLATKQLDSYYSSLEVNSQNSITTTEAE